MIPVFEHSWPCDPYDALLPHRSIGPEVAGDDPYPLIDCWAPPPIPIGSGPEGVLGWLIAILGMYLAARLSNQSPERVAISVGIGGSLLAAPIGFARSGLDPFLVLTDPVFYSSFPLTITFAVILGKLERRRRAAAA